MCNWYERERFINPIQISLRCWPQPPLFELNRRSRNESNHIYISNLPTIESALGLLRKIGRVTKIFNALSEHTHSPVRLNILTSAQFQSPHGMLPSAPHKKYFAQNWQRFALLTSPAHWLWARWRTRSGRRPSARWCRTRRGGPAAWPARRVPGRKTWSCSRIRDFPAGNKNENKNSLWWISSLDPWLWIPIGLSLSGAPRHDGNT